MNVYVNDATGAFKAISEYGAQGFAMLAKGLEAAKKSSQGWFEWQGARYWLDGFGDDVLEGLVAGYNDLVECGYRNLRSAWPDFGGECPTHDGDVVAYDETRVVWFDCDGGLHLCYKGAYGT